MDEQRRDFLQTLERGLQVVTAFTGRERTLSVPELSRATGLPKPTVRRILLTLESLGYAVAEDGRYALTPRVLSLGYAYLSSLDLSGTAQPLMESLTDALGLGTSLAVLDGVDVVYVNRVQRHRITNINLAIGTRLPAHATSMGHVLLAGLSEHALATYLDTADLPALTIHTLTEPAELEARIRAVRVRGWDIVDQELEIGRRSVAAPVTDASDRVVAALSLSCGTAEFSAEQLRADFVEPVARAARRISELLGANVSGAGYDSRDLAR